MSAIESFLHEKLSERSKNGSLRTLSTKTGLIDFSSNDYLGFARSTELFNRVNIALNDLDSYPLGATGSRLISGNDLFTEQLEAAIALFHRAQAGLIFNSGYDANLGFFSAVPQRNDTILHDELIHASVIDGARLSLAARHSFKHNDLNDLEEKLKRASGKAFIAVESVYSMDGDEAPLVELANLADRYHAALVVDEAHATGIFGDQGSGLVCHYDLCDRVFARIITFGKALGAHGAIVLGTQTLRNYLVNFARSFIYSTAANFQTHLGVSVAYTYLQSADHQTPIRDLIALFKRLTPGIGNHFIGSNSPIQCLLVGGNDATKRFSSSLAVAGFDVRPILSPTVPAGKERLRICLHSFNSAEEIARLASSLNAFLV